MQVLDRRKAMAIAPLLRLAFRPFFLAGCLPTAGAHGANAFSTALHHDHADFLDLPETRLLGRITRILPEM